METIRKIVYKSLSYAVKPAIVCSWKVVLAIRYAIQMLNCLASLNPGPEDNFPA